MVLPKRKKRIPILTIDSDDWNLIGSNSSVDTLRVSRSSSGAMFLELLLLGEVKESLVLAGLEISFMEFVKEIVRYTEHPNEKLSIPGLIEALYQSLDEIHQSNYEFNFECEYEGALSVKGISISFEENSLYIGTELLISIVDNWEEHKIEIINR